MIQSNSVTKLVKLGLGYEPAPPPPPTPPLSLIMFFYFPLPTYVCPLKYFLSDRCMLSCGDPAERKLKFGTAHETYHELALKLYLMG